MAIADLPFLQPSHITYQGAFRVPQARNGDSSLMAPGVSVSPQHAGYGMCFNPVSGGLFMSAFSGEASAIWEITIPANPVISGNRNDLPTATVIQPFRRFDPPMGRALDVPPFNSTQGSPGFESFPFSQGLTEVTGILVYGGDLYLSYMYYYDGGAQQNRSHVRMTGLNLSTGDFDALALVHVAPNLVYNGQSVAGHHAGNVGMNMQHVPVEWRAELGNKPCITGANGYGIVTRTGAMPSAFGWTPSDLNPTVPAQTVLYQHGFAGGPGQSYPNPGDPAYGATVNTWHGPPSPNAWYRGTNFDRGYIPIPGTRTILDWHVGAPRDAWVIYGNGTTVAQPPAPHPLAGQTYSDSVMGPSGNGYYGIYPGASTYSTLNNVGAYERTFRFYDAMDWKSVYTGSQPQDFSKPYAEKTLTWSIGHANTRWAGGGTIDPTNRKIYVVDTWGEYTGVAYYPLIHVYSYDVPGTTAPTTVANAEYRVFRYTL